MSFGHIKLKVADIIVEDRARKDYGDLRELMNSIEEFGLIQPITVDGDNRLLAGGRRLEAHKQLGLEEIDAFSLGHVSAANQLVIELVENTVRKDFNWQEDVELKKRIHDLLDVQAQSRGIDNWTEGQTAEVLGLTRSMISKDLTLAAAIRAMPELTQHDTKGKALAAYSKLKRRALAMICMNQMDPEERERLEAMQKMDPTVFTSATREAQEGPQNSGAALTPPPVTEGQDDPVLGVSGGTPAGESAPPRPVKEVPPCSYIVAPWTELLPKFPKASIGFCEMDPPYAMNFENTYGQTQNTIVDFVDWSPDVFRSEMKSLLADLRPRLIPDSWVLLWTAIEWVPFLTELAKSLDYRTQLPGVWVKPGGATNSLRTNMISNYEVYLLLAHGKPQFNTSRLLAAFEAKSLSGTDKIHATEKPVNGVYDHLFSALARPGTNFFSPFAGSGNSLLAAATHGMTPFGCDINDKYREQFYIRYHKHFNGGL